MSFVASDLSYSVGASNLLRAVTINLQAGELHVVIGPNGSGKSTLLKLLSGELRPQQGTITLNQKPLGQWTSLEQAQQRAVLPQNDHLNFSFTSEQVVALGRLPCRQQSPQQEQAIVREALKATDALHLAQRDYLTLSGGERARVQLARILAQVWEPINFGPRYLLLDEPTANLDLAHQHLCLQLARTFVSQNAGALVILHDLKLGLMHADRVTLLCCGEVIATGAPLEVLTAQNLARVYGVRVELIKSTTTNHPYIVVEKLTQGLR